MLSLSTIRGTILKLKLKLVRACIWASNQTCHHERWHEDPMLGPHE